MRVRGNALLVELLIVILFLSVSSIVTINLFLTARTKGDRATETNRALFALEDIAERIASCDDPQEELLACGFVPYGDTMLLESELFTVVASLFSEETGAGLLWHIDLQAYSSVGASIVALRADRYLPEVIA